MERTVSASASTDCIQPLGWLALLDSHWAIQSASTNLEAQTGRATQATVGAPLAELLGGDAVHELRNQLALARPGGCTFLFALATDAGTFDFAIGGDPERPVVEARAAQPGNSRDLIASVCGLIDRLWFQSDLPSVIARQAGALTGYGCAGLYSCDDKGAATLAAERSFKASQLPLDLQPADLAAWSAAPTLIGDCDAEPISLSPPKSCAGALFKAPADRDRDVLRRRGSRSVLRLPLRIGDELRALLWLEHPEPRIPSFAQLSAYRLFAHMAALTMAARAAN